MRSGRSPLPLRYPRSPRGCRFAAALCAGCACVSESVRCSHRHRVTASTRRVSEANRGATARDHSGAVYVVAGRYAFTFRYGTIPASIFRRTSPGGRTDSPRCPILPIRKKKDETAICARAAGAIAKLQASAVRANRHVEPTISLILAFRGKFSCVTPSCDVKTRDALVGYLRISRKTCNFDYVILFRSASFWLSRGRRCAVSMTADRTPVTLAIVNGAVWTGDPSRHAPRL